MNSSDEENDFFAKCEASPAFFAREVLGIEPTPQQLQLLEAISLPGAHVAVRSGHGTGKSTSLAIIALWFLCTRHDAKIPCTAPAAHQLEDVLWGEIRRLHAGMGEWTRDQISIKADKITIDGSAGYIVARTARKENPDALQGFHADNILFIIDEAAGVHDKIFEVAQGALSTPGARVVMTANPTKLTGYFFDAFNINRDNWIRMHFNCVDSPLVDPSYAEGMAREYGEDSDIFRIRVRDFLASSNFYVVLHPLYGDWLKFGIGLMLCMTDADSLIRFYHQKPGSYWIAQNRRRIVDTVYIRHVSRASDIANEYGIENCPQCVRDALKTDGAADRKFVIVQCIQPWNFFGDAGKSAAGHEYEDVRFVEGCSDEDPVLYRGGYVTRPFICARWSEIGEDVYPGSCPGIDALPDIRELYREMENYNLGREWHDNPAFWTDDPTVKSVNPGDIVVVSGSNKIGVQSIIPPVHDLSIAFRSQADLLDRISAILYNREIMMISGRAMQNHQMTATEAALLDQEKSAIMGPIVVRGGLDILVASLDRVFDILTREWVLLDEAPEEIRGMDVRPHFTSNLAITQRQAEIQRINQFDQWVMNVASFNPQVMDSANQSKARLCRLTRVTTTLSSDLRMGIFTSR